MRFSKPKFLPMRFYRTIILHRLFHQIAWESLAVMETGNEQGDYRGDRLLKKPPSRPIWLNRRAAALPLASLVSPASSTPPVSATGRGGVTEPLPEKLIRDNKSIGASSTCNSTVPSIYMVSLWIRLDWYTMMLQLFKRLVGISLKYEAAYDSQK